MKMTDTPIDQLPADHFDPPVANIPRFGWVTPKQPADAIEGAL